jgi:ketosteroid isomerase-like protein
MSQENVAIVIGQFEGVNRRDFEAVMDAYADDVVLRSHGWLRNIGAIAVVGKEAVGEWFGDWFRTFDRDYRFEVDEARDLGDRVLIVATHHGRGRISGAPATQQMGYLYTVRDGKVSLVEIWTDQAQALEAVGLQE